MSRHIISSLSVLSVVVALAGCGSDDGGSTTAAATDSGADTAKAAAMLTGKLAIPADFKGEPVRVVLAAASALPLTGAPDGGILFEDKAPKITAGGTYEINADTSGLTGKYHVLAIVYVKGGGTFAPKADLDYDAATSAALSFDGKSAVDMGTLTMAVHKSGDGH